MTVEYDTSAGTATRSLRTRVGKVNGAEQVPRHLCPVLRAPLNRRTPRIGSKNAIRLTGILQIRNLRNGAEGDGVPLSGHCRARTCRSGVSLGTSAAMGRIVDDESLAVLVSAPSTVAEVEMASRKGTPVAT